ncbi:MAG: YggS family pyridoxal phosphate-dependent enzyme, partial [Clostridia bacterium]|nr:YggS family pyridoxal phosphate-dependent enzyme [Clostridia bacterium]
MIKENLEVIYKTLPKTNPYGEKVTLVAATKTRSVEEINEAITAGITDIGENKAQEFRDKYPEVLPCRYHFFVRLQKNNIKYLIGKAYL